MAYAVTWCENGGTEYAGKLDLEGDWVQLSGAASGHRASTCRLRASDMKGVQVERRGGRPLAGRPTLVLVGRDGTELCVTPFQGLGIVHEIADRIADVRGKAAI